MNNILSQGRKSAQPRQPGKPKGTPAKKDSLALPMESPMVALVNHRQVAPIDTSSDMHESPLSVLINQRGVAPNNQMPVAQLEPPISALINGREPKPLNELPAQQESPIYTLVNKRQ
jgi:hypothetical protein